MADFEGTITGEEPQLPAEKAMAATVKRGGIGQARFAGMTRSDGSMVPANKLPEGEDPAGWFIVGNIYVNCDGLTPEQVQESSVDYHRNKAAVEKKRGDDLQKQLDSLREVAA